MTMLRPSTHKPTRAVTCFILTTPHTWCEFSLCDGSVMKEPHDLLPGAGDYRPADVAPSAYLGDDKPKALDIFVGSVITAHTNRSGSSHPDLIPLIYMEIAKMNADATKITELGLTPQ